MSSHVCALPPPLEGAQAGTGRFSSPGREGEAYLPSRANTVLVIRFVYCQVLESFLGYCV